MIYFAPNMISMNCLTSHTFYIEVEMVLTTLIFGQCIFHKSLFDSCQATKAGIVVWSVRPGDIVIKGQILGEIIDIEDPDAVRTSVCSRTNGIVFSMARHQLVRPGQVIIKVAGDEVLEWRKGNLLTSR